MNATKTFGDRGYQEGVLLIGFFRTFTLSTGLLTEKLRLLSER